MKLSRVLSSVEYLGMRWSEKDPCDVVFYLDTS